MTTRSGAARELSQHGPRVGRSTRAVTPRRVGKDERSSSSDPRYADHPDRFTYATLDMRDGSSIAGYAYLFTVGEVPIEEREIVLIRAKGIPISVRTPGESEFQEIDDRLVALLGRDVFSLAVKYVKRPARSDSIVSTIFGE